MIYICFVPEMSPFDPGSLPGTVLIEIVSNKILQLLKLKRMHSDVKLAGLTFSKYFYKCLQYVFFFNNPFPIPDWREINTLCSL